MRTEERFWSKVEVSDPDSCWNWTRAKDKNGYGKFSLNNSWVGAHRMAWQLTNGPTPLHVLHRCDNPSCCNPSHLFIGTHSDNMKDAISKGRKNKPFPPVPIDVKFMKKWVRNLSTRG